jgi:ribosomal protein S18 acetylase RimI-like enzyme
MIRYSYKREVDASQIDEIYNEGGWVKKSNANSIKHLSNMFKNSDFIVSAWDGKKLIGIVRALTDKYENGFILGLMVRKSYRGRGIGTNLLKKCISKYPKIEWFIFTSNKKAEKLYKSLGFKYCKEILLNKK